MLVALNFQHSLRQDQVSHCFPGRSQAGETSTLQNNAPQYVAVIGHIVRTQSDKATLCIFAVLCKSIVREMVSRPVMAVLVWPIDSTGAVTSSRMKLRSQWRRVHGPDKFVHGCFPTRNSGAVLTRPTAISSGMPNCGVHGLGESPV